MSRAVRLRLSDTYTTLISFTSLEQVSQVRISIGTTDGADLARAKAATLALVYGGAVAEAVCEKHINRMREIGERDNGAGERAEGDLRHLRAPSIQHLDSLGQALIWGKALLMVMMAARARRVGFNSMLDLLVGWLMKKVIDWYGTWWIVGGRCSWRREEGVE